MFVLGYFFYFELNKMVAYVRHHAVVMMVAHFFGFCHGCLDLTRPIYQTGVVRASMIFVVVAR